MSSWILNRRISSSDGSKCLDIEEGPGPIFRYVSYKWMDACEEDEGALGDGMWIVDQRSGLFGSQELCERDATVILASWGPLRHSSD